MWSRLRMNTQKRRIYSPLVAILIASLTGWVAGEGRTVHIARTFDASAIKRIELREMDGEIRIDAAAPNTISPDPTVHSWMKHPDPKTANQGVFDTSVDAHTLLTS